MLERTKTCPLHCEASEASLLNAPRVLVPSVFELTMCLSLAVLPSLLTSHRLHVKDGSSGAQPSHQWTPWRQMEKARPL